MDGVLPDLDSLFRVGIPITEKILRAVLVYLFLVVALRLAGKRELAQINTLDLVVLLTLSNTVQNAIIGRDDSLLGGLVGASALLGSNALLVWFLYRKPGLSRLLEGKPAILIRQGKLQEACLKKEEITRAELEETAQKQGYATLSEIETATLQPSGAITFVSVQPTGEIQRHQAVMARLEELSRQVEALQRDVKQ